MRVAPLAVDGPEWSGWQERVGVLLANGMPEHEAEYEAARQLGLLMPETSPAASAEA